MRKYYLVIAIILLFYGIGANAQDSSSAVVNEERSVPIVEKKSVGVVLSSENTDMAAFSMVTIGNQTWMKSNLDVSVYRNGDEIPQVQDPVQWANLTTGAWCYYENKSENGTVYGKLYNWYAVHDVRGLAPSGWHIPSDEEWSVLTDFLGGESKAGAQMIASVQNSNTVFPFLGFLGGSRNDYSGKFYSMGRSGMWWSATAIYGAYAWYRGLYINSPEVTVII